MNFSLILLCKFLFLFTPAAKDIPVNIYDFKVAAENGREIDFAAYKGKKILIVNVPLTMPYDPQYAELSELYTKYKDKLVIIGFITDGFGTAPGSKPRPANYPVNIKTAFPLAAKVAVRGKGMDPIYKWLTDIQYNKLKSSEVKWNFQKYLINKEGALVAVFDPKVRASNPKLIAAIEQQ